MSKQFEEMIDPTVVTLDHALRIFREDKDAFPHLCRKIFANELKLSDELNSFVTEMAYSIGCF